MQPIIGALILPLAMVAWAAPAHEPDYDFDESFLDDLFEDVQTFKENMKTGDQQRCLFTYAMFATCIRI